MIATLSYFVINLKRMSSKDKNLSTYKIDSIPDSSEFNIGLVISEWNEEITYTLRDGCIKSLKKHGVLGENIHAIYVPGSFELPLGAKLVAAQDKMHAIICLGCVIKGETSHDQYINSAVANGIMTLNVASGVPVVFGVLTPNDLEQAKDRAGGKHGNKGVEAAITALKMAHLAKELKEPKKKIGY